MFAVPATVARLNPGVATVVFATLFLIGSGHRDGLLHRWDEAGGRPATAHTAHERRR